MTDLTYAQQPLVAKTGVLRPALFVDAIVCLLIAAGGILTPGTTMQMLGITDGGISAAMTIFFLVYGVPMLYFSRAAHIPRPYVWLNVVVDTTWALSSLAIIFTGALPLSDAGKIIIFLGADLSLIMAGLKYLGLRQKE